MKGIIKFYQYARGYGFIESEDGTEYWYHVSSLEPRDAYPQKGEGVEFDVKKASRKGLNDIAIRIRFTDVKE